MTYKGNEITEELLASLLDKQVTAIVRQYSYHTHGVRRSGTIVAHFGESTTPTYYFAAAEWYGIEDIFELKEGWD